MSSDPLPAVVMGGACSLTGAEDDGSDEDEVGEDGSEDGGRDNEGKSNDSEDDADEAKNDEGKGDGEVVIAEDLGNLSLHNRAYRPHRDQKAGHSDVKAEGEAAVHASYLHGNRETLRMLVKKSITRKHKIQARQTQPKRDSRSVCTRSNKSKRGAMKDALDLQGWW